MPAYTKGPDDTRESYGPSWADCHSLWRQLEARTGAKLEMHAILVTSVSGRSGYKFVASLNGFRFETSAVGFGPGYESGPRTAPAAWYNVMTNLWDKLEDPDNQDTRWAASTVDGN